MSPDRIPAFSGTPERDWEQSHPSPCRAIAASAIPATVLHAIATLLQQRIGFDLKTLQTSRLTRAVAQAMHQQGETDPNAYWLRLQTSIPVFQALIETLVVPETWFFRDQQPFVLLRQYVLQEWLPTRSQAPLRVLSVPCATGEEPYSIAITLLQTGIAPDAVHIDAIDLSQRALAQAQQALYTNYSFRENPLVPESNLDSAIARSLYFRPTDHGYQLDPKVVRMVHFSHGNLLDPTFLLDSPPYDLLFCRNLLIYLDRQARSTVIQTLKRLLAPQGLLFVGHTEVGAVLAHDLVPVRHPFAFALKKAMPHNAAPIVSKTAPPSVPPSSPSPKRPPRETTTVLSKAAVAPSTPRPTVAPPTQLHEAKQLANQGKLQDAIACCQTYLTHHRTDAEAYVLLGVVQQALGQDNQATHSFERAIYLDPNHSEALFHLALLKECQGDRLAATRIKQRIQRLKS